MMNELSFDDLKSFLDQKVDKYNQSGFIENDPISIPHSYKLKQDIEISAFISAIFAWGNRKNIIKKCQVFFSQMDNSPYDFILNHSEKDLSKFMTFKHRTFNQVDALYFIRFFRWHYKQFDSLELAFMRQSEKTTDDVTDNLKCFYNYFFSLPDSPVRTQKHISTPAKKSACKRINMFLRWMVRKDDNGVDFGLWDKIKSSELICPCDVHVERVSRSLGLLKSKKLDWSAAVELTTNLRLFDPNDPVKYDFALFGLGVEEKFY